LLPSDDRPLGVLALLDDPAPMQSLVLRLRSQGFLVDVAHDLAAARTLFFGAGGHDCLVVGPDVRPSLAVRVLRALRSVDPELPTATFGPDLQIARTPIRDAMLRAFHPGSRAGEGALLRFLQKLSPRQDPER